MLRIFKAVKVANSASFKNNVTFSRFASMDMFYASSFVRRYFISECFSHSQLHSYYDKVDVLTIVQEQVGTSFW